MRTTVRQFGTVGMVTVAIAVGCAMPLTENPDASVTPAQIAISTPDLVPPTAEPALVEHGRGRVEDFTPYLKITPTVASPAYPPRK